MAQATLPKMSIRIYPMPSCRTQALIVRYDDKAFSLTDALSFVVMDRLQITSAFTFDRNFLQYGVLSLTLG
jgi:predicted nucleic acid-binding protein